MSVPPLPEGDLAWNYFPDNYRWSHGMLIALGGAPWGGAEIGEVHRVGLRLQSCVAMTSRGSAPGRTRPTA